LGVSLCLASAYEAQRVAGLEERQLWSPEVGMEVVAYSVRQSRARRLGEPPLFLCVSVLSEYIKLTYHPRVVLLLHSTKPPAWQYRPLFFF
jgi:hypothetical protein